MAQRLHTTAEVARLLHTTAESSTTTPTAISHQALTAINDTPSLDLQDALTATTSVKTSVTSTARPRPGTLTPTLLGRTIKPLVATNHLDQTAHLLDAMSIQRNKLEAELAQLTKNKVVVPLGSHNNNKLPRGRRWHLLNPLRESATTAAAMTTFHANAPRSATERMEAPGEAQTIPVPRAEKTPRDSHRPRWQAG